MSGASKLAILGGEKVIPDGLIKNWPPIDDIDRQYVLASLEETNHAFGPNCVALEKEWAEWNGNKYAITTNSGTAALHMGIVGCDCGAGDEVIVPAYSWSSSATCIVQHNCIPVFVDIDYDTMNMDVEKVEAAITEKTKAIIAVHLHGLPLNMEKICKIAQRHSLKVIEDACQAHGAEYRGVKVGRWGDCAAFSLNQNKTLCSGEGGLFVTDNEQILQKAKSLWSFGETRSPVEDRDYHVYAMGWMYRNNDLTAAFARAQLTKLDYYLEMQERNSLVLKEDLEDVRGLTTPMLPEGCKHSWYNFVCHINPEVFGYHGKASTFRDAVMKGIQAEGAPVSVWQRFILPAMTIFRAKNAYGKGCPWRCPYAASVSYSPDRYSAAQTHCDTHFGITESLRAPNNEKVARTMGAAIRKVFDNIDKLDIDKIATEGR